MRTTIGLVAVALLIGGCGSPNTVNVALRKENQALTEQLAQLQAQEAADRARILELEQGQGAVPTLAQSRLDKLFTVRAISLGRLTGAVDDRSDRDLRVYLAPEDEAGEVVKSTGQVTVEAFDLNEASGLRIGRWQWTADQLKAQWRSLGPLRAFVLPCRLDAPSPHAQVALKVSFRDELTGRLFTQLKEITIGQLVGAARTQPSTRP